MNQYTLDGVALRDPQLRWYTDRNTGIRIIPARRTPNQQFPGVDGNITVLRQPYDPGAVSIRLQVTGNSWEDLRTNIEFLTGLITQRYRLMELREHLGDEMGDRVAKVSLASSVEPTIRSKRSALIEALFTVPETFWRSANDSVATLINTITTTPTEGDLAGFAGGNAPIDDALIRVSGGEFSELLIEDVATGYKLRVNHGLTYNQQLLIDPKNWKAVIQPIDDNNWSTDTGTDISGRVIPSRGYGSMFMMEPILDAGSMSFRYRVRVSGINTTGLLKLSMRAKRAYL